MNLIKNNFVLLLMLGLLFTACQKDDVTGPDLVDLPGTETETTTVNPLVGRTSGANGEGLELDCIKILFPFQMIDVEDNTYDVTQESDFEIVFTNEVPVIDFVYPLSLEINGENSSAASGDELAEFFAECIPAGGWEEDYFPAYLIDMENSCFELVYPLDLIDLDGSTVTVANESELNGELAAQEYSFAFPLSLLDEEGNAIVAENIDGLFELLISCNGFEIDDTTYFEWETGFEYIGCYMIAFPMDVIIADGSTVTVENHMELCDLMLQGEMVSYAFPMTLTDEEGETYEVANEDELAALISECEEVVIPELEEGIFDLLNLLTGQVVTGPNGENCYEINFPLQMVNENGLIITINDIEADFENIFQELGETSSLVYPVSVVRTDNGENQEFNDGLEILEFLDGCF